MPSHRFAEVVFPLPLDQSFTYEVPESLASRAAIGMRAVVPMGRRIDTGYIVGLTDTATIAHVRALVDLPDEAPAFAPTMLGLCRWIAEYYCCSLGEALQCAAPSGLSVRTKMRYRLVPEQLTAGRYTDGQRAVIAELHRRGPLTEGQLATAVGRGALGNTLQLLVRRGILLAEPIVQRPGVSIKTETYVRLVEAHVPPVEELGRLQRAAPKQAAVYLDLLHGEPERAATTLYEKHHANATMLKALEEKGLIERFERELCRAPEYQADARSATKHDLNNEQRQAYEAIAARVSAGEFRTFLLRGITGSGKTEVYLQAIEHALRLGRDAIILVPEISLTPQTVGRFYARFHEQIAVLHSALGRGERFDEWRRAQRGEVRIVVGARSAVFAPLPNVGIIVVDEEHDTSYKQGETPRYHGRDVAIMRAKMAGAACVLGSATPSIEASHNAEIGKFTLLELRRRATNARLPQVRVLDMREERREHGGQMILSNALEQAVLDRVRLGEQVILLLNRRGYSPFVLCPQCGWVAQCPNCNVSFTYHASDGRLHCHYCEAQRERPAVCDTCGFASLVYLGTGTQKVEDLLMRTFEHCRIERMDRDTTAGKGGHAKILGRFAAGEIDILIGTQMIAKGHDYPGVTLVGVINADTGLSVPDFRAAENTFQLITQVAGRAGRGARPGEVIIQTFRPNHYAIQAAANQDYAVFYAQELEQRRAAGYPPFRRMANFLIESEDPLDAQRAVVALQRLVRDQIEALGFQGIQIIGPAPAAVARVKKKYRWNLGALSKSTTRLNALARATRCGFGEAFPHSGVQLKIDLDPYGAY
ncbi:MAG TPA: primosomal protein N' [Candidatus Hydrogenedentes bacterium]|nr:primosomal protein N' [Candidatus Hydrogenedentota bacterium]HPG67109.1 primosomal protein N' [Candidatus Hydrogenedentota bacterium]